MVWLVFLLVFENISCPNPDFIPMSKFSLLKMGPLMKIVGTRAVSDKRSPEQFLKIL